MSGCMFVINQFIQFRSRRKSMDFYGGGGKMINLHHFSKPLQFVIQFSRKALQQKKLKT